MIDTDNFKLVNDKGGHLFGDAVLSEIAAGMKKIVRKSDVVGRIGGDEFTIFIKNISSAEAAKVKAQQLLDIFHHLFEKDKQSVAVTCSIGIAMYPWDGIDFQSLYGSADQALYDAKNRGKNCYTMYEKNGRERFLNISDLPFSQILLQTESLLPYPLFHLQAVQTGVHNFFRHLHRPHQMQAQYERLRYRLSM